MKAKALGSAALHGQAERCMGQAALAKLRYDWLSAAGYHFAAAEWERRCLAVLQDRFPDPTARFRTKAIIALSAEASGIHGGQMLRRAKRAMRRGER